MFGQLKDLGALMKQAQEMQQKMAEMQAKLAALELAGRSGGGLVKVTVDGKGETRRVEIDPSLLVPAERGVLEDLLVAAMNDARSKVEAEAQQQMQQITGGLPLPPGFKLGGRGACDPDLTFPRRGKVPAGRMGDVEDGRRVR